MWGRGRAQKWACTPGPAPVTCLSVPAASAAGEKARRWQWLQLLGRGDCSRSTGLGRWQRRQWRRGPDPRRGPNRRRAPRGQRRLWSCGSVSSIAPHVIPLPAALVVLRGGRGPLGAPGGFRGHQATPWLSGPAAQRHHLTAGTRMPGDLLCQALCRRRFSHC